MGKGIVSAVALMLLSSCGAGSSGADLHIKGGEQVPEGSVLSQYVVGLSKPDMIANGNTFCSGSLISSRVVLTAAHCVTADKETLHFPKEQFRVVIGRDVASAKVVPIDLIGWHASYDPEGTVSSTSIEPPNDVALIRLKEPQEGPYVRLSQFLPEEGENVLLSGWGTTNGVSGTGILRYVIQRVTFLDLERSRIETANRQEDNAQGACGGDSGGPLFRSDRAGDVLQAGILSIGTMNPITGYCYAWNAWTSVSDYLPWINSGKAYLESTDQPKSPAFTTFL